MSKHRTTDGKGEGDFSLGATAGAVSGCLETGSAW